MSVHTERVERGTALLDAECPGWVDEINLDTLDLGSTEDCVLGQLFGEYWKGARRLLTGNSLTARDFGFVANCGVREDCTCVAEYRDLTQEWKDHITMRRVLDAVPDRKEHHAFA